MTYNHDLHGFIGGYEKLLDGNLFGLFIVMSNSQSQTKTISINEIEIRSISINTTGGFMGTYIQNSYAGFVINRALEVGYESHNSKHLVIDDILHADIQIGNQIAKGKYNSIYMSP